MDQRNITGQGNRTGQRMMIVSLDAVGQRDLPFLMQQPSFRKLRDVAAYCDHVESVYPSITYPAHTSIVTGRMPYHHRIVNNIKVQPNRRGREDWLWQRQYVSGNTLYDLAARNGYRVAGLLWPVTAAGKIRYCVPEVFANRSWQNQIMVSMMNGPIGYQLELYRRFGHLMDGTKQPQLDDFVTESAIYTIYKYNPDLFLIHLTDVDTNRHLYGVDAPQSREALLRHDVRLGRFVKALEETGDMEKTTIVVLGDHCQMDTHTVVYPNYYLKKAGFWHEKDGRIYSYDFYAQHCDGSCYIYMGRKLRNQMRRMERKKRREVMEKLRMTLKEIPAEMVSRIIPRREVIERGGDDACVCMLEAKSGYYFQNDAAKPFEPVAEKEDSKMRATHGYLPDLPDYATFFMMSGYGVREHAHVQQMHLWDEAPTLAAILGVSLGKTDGQKMEQLLK